MSEAIFPVVFPGPLGEPPDGPDDLAAAARQSLALLSVLPARIGAVLAGISWRAIVGGPYADNMVPAAALAGPPGCGKTSFGEVALGCLPLKTGTRGGRRNADAETATASRAADALQARGRGLVLTEVPALGRSILTACGGGSGAVDVLMVPIGAGEITPLLPVSRQVLRQARAGLHEAGLADARTRRESEGGAP
jgi:hypothetical protein